MANNTNILLGDEDVLKEEPISIFSPHNPTPTETIFLSNIDQAVAFPVETVFFYEAPPKKASSSTTKISELVKESVENVLLIPYYFMAGRLNFNDETKRLELVCNNAGVLFVNATSRFSLEDLGNLSHPNPTFHQFVHRPGLYKSLPETAIFTIQVTRFACGGFALGFTTNHAILDGKAASQMFNNLASICRGETLKTRTIDNDRTCIRSRTPPQINFPHKEYIKVIESSFVASSFTSEARKAPSPLIFSEKYTHRLFSFTPEMLQMLKEKVEIKCSTFEAIVAQIWRARTVAYFDDHDSDEESMVLFAVDVREKALPRLPSSFVGNAVITAFASASVRDLVKKPMSFGVEMVRRGRERVSAEYIKSVIDWLEVYKGIPATGNGGAFYVSAWWKLPFGDVDLGFGRPKHAGPIVSGNDEFVLLLGNGNDNGINVWIGLHNQKMKRFSSYLQQNF